MGKAEQRKKLIALIKIFTDETSSNDQIDEAGLELAVQFHDWSPRHRISNDDQKAMDLIHRTAELLKKELETVVFQLVDNEWVKAITYKCQSLEEAINDFGEENVRKIANGVYSIHEDGNLFGVLVTGEKEEKKNGS